MESIKEILAKLERSLQNQASSTQKLELSAKAECSDCGDLGYVMDEAKKMRECECVKEKRVMARIPERYRKASLLDFDEETRALILDWMARPSDGLFLTGKAGRGKTYLAAAIVRTFLLINREAWFHRADDLFAQVRRGYRDGIDEDDTLKKFLVGDYAVLDDVGAGSLSDHERRCTLAVIDRRFGLCCSTIVTTNWDLEQIAQRMDERIASRLASFTQIEMGGRDRRISV
jgi:DNA replication protein DnaC